MQKEETFDPGNMKFRALLRMFDGIIDKNPKPETIQEKLQGLKELAGKASELTFRQVEAIVGRCNSYIDGSYGRGKENVEFKTA